VVAEGAEQVIDDDGVTGGERAGRRHRTVGDVEAVLGSVLAQRGVVQFNGVVSVSCGTVAADVDHGVVYRAPASQ
jgi:hypothetical protein